MLFPVFRIKALVLEGNKLTINQLKYVITISKSSSMREAAGSLFVSQPALSASIAELEAELDMVLFERTNKGVRITPEGKDFLEYAKKVIGQYAVLEERYLSEDKHKERFSVSTQHYTFAIKCFTKVVKAFDPETYEFNIHETRTGEVLENVRDLKSEVGVVSFTGDTEKILKKLIKEYQLEFVPLMTRETYVYFWKNHPLANRDSVSIEELGDYPCVSFEQGSENDFYLNEEALGNYHFKKMIKSDDRATSMEIIAELGGYSIGSGMLSGQGQVLKGLISVKLKEEDPLTIGYITRKGHKLSVFAKAYVDELNEYKEI